RSLSLLPLQTTLSLFPYTTLFRSRAWTKINISHIDHYESTKAIQNSEDGFLFHFISTRIVGGADKYDLGEIIHLLEDLVRPKLKIVAQVYPLDSDIVDFGADLVHAISRR